MPILGVIDSSKSGNLYASSYESIQTLTVSSTGNFSVTFTSIPQTYKHLQIRYSARQTSTNAGESLVIFSTNSTSQAGYFTTRLYGVGTGSAVTDSFSGAAPFLMMPSGGNPSNMFGSGIIDFPDYTNTTNYKAIKVWGGMENDGGAGQSHRWHGIVGGENTNTFSAITDIALAVYAGSSSTGIAVNSTFALYGMKG
jgi:hypothetical protein